MSTIAYHLGELATACDPTDPHHLLPTLTHRDRTVLDIGCGVGQTLIALEDDTPRTFIGVDVDTEALAFGHSLADDILLLGAGADAIPLPDASVDCVVSRVALPYTDFPRAVAEIGRVTKPGGRCWITLHDVAFGLRALWSDVRRLHVKGIAYNGYVLANGMRLHLTGTVGSYPLKRQRLESVQTTRAARRAFERAGFAVVAATHDRGRFIVTARRLRADHTGPIPFGPQALVH